VNAVVKGLPNKLIARELNITERTVKAHLTAVFEKLQVSDRIKLVLFVTSDKV
jgi:DNA-binding NarL/FixJ family response regulator